MKDRPGIDEWRWEERADVFGLEFRIPHSAFRAGGGYYT